MAKLDLTFACVPTDRTRPILDGTIELPSVRIKALPGEPEEIFRRALRDQEFDITEMSMSSHITVTARGGPHYVAIPTERSSALRISRRNASRYSRTSRRPCAPSGPPGATWCISRTT